MAYRLSVGNYHPEWRVKQPESRYVVMAQVELVPKPIPGEGRQDAYAGSVIQALMNGLVDEA